MEISTIFHGKIHYFYGNLLQFAIENGPVEIVSFPIKNGGYFHSYVKVYQRVSKHWKFTPRVVIFSGMSWDATMINILIYGFWANRNGIYPQFMSGENDNNEKYHGWFWYRQTHVSTQTCSFVTLWDVATFAHDCDRIGKWPRGLLNKREYLLLWIQVQ